MTSSERGRGLSAYCFNTGARENWDGTVKKKRWWQDFQIEALRVNMIVSWLGTVELEASDDSEECLSAYPAAFALSGLNKIILECKSCKHSAVCTAFSPTGADHWVPHLYGTGGAPREMRAHETSCRPSSVLTKPCGDEAITAGATEWLANRKEVCHRGRNVPTCSAVIECALMRPGKKTCLANCYHLSTEARIVQVTPCS